MGYPESKDFKVCKDSLDDYNCYPDDAIKKIPDDANIFAKEFRENALNDDTTLGGSVNMNIRAW